MRVKFSAADEFVQELYQERGRVEDGILRLTFCYQQSKHAPLTYMSVVAGVIVRGKIIELQQYVGQVIDTPAPHEGSNRVKAKAEIIRANIKVKARDLELEVRAGMFEP